MVRVCHVTSVHSTYDERIFYKECVSLANNGYEVMIVGPGESRVDQGVEIIGIGEKPISRIRRMIFFSRKVYDTAIDLECDIYHFHDPELLKYAFKAKKRGKIVIFDSHEDYPADIADKEYIGGFIKKVLIKYYTKFEKKVLATIDAVISVTPHLTERLKKLSKTVVLVTNYPKISNANEIIMNQEKVDAICFTGAVNDSWSHRDIVAALSSMNDVEYHIYGKADNAYIEKLVEISNGKVVYKGYVEHSKVLKIQAKYIAGMCLCKYQANTGWKIGTLGNTKVFEYMLAGIPVICTDFILWKEIIKKHECGKYVNPDNSKEIANAIMYYIKNRDIAIKHGKNGQNAILKEYNWNSEEDKLLNLYDYLSNK